MPRARLRVCSVPGCPAVQVETLCPEHRRERERHQRATVPTKMTHTWSEVKRRRAVVSQWRARHGDVCPGWGKQGPHRTSDLTADHVVPVAAGGAPDGPLIVRCRSCNSSKGAC